MALFLVTGKTLLNIVYDMLLFAWHLIVSLTSSWAPPASVLAGISLVITSGESSAPRLG